MANDCSERVCQFGNAHVDSPKGDLDASSGKLTGPGITVIPNDAVYPYGTAEQYPQMMDTTQTVITNTAHAYAECSNKGVCDRTAGVCGCFPGYEGSACQRASCPTSASGFCSGHGQCKSVSDIAGYASGNAYELWDQSATMGCVCDPGYKGADCSQKVCKAGADPLYHGDYNTARYPSFTYIIYSSRSSAAVADLAGNYSITFFDWNGQPWHTAPIQASDTCAGVIQALEALPNSVVPLGTVRCTTTAFSQLPAAVTAYTSYKRLKTFTLVFTGNPGALKPIDLNLNLDGTRRTLYLTTDTASHTPTLGYSVFPNGYAGENTDVVPDLCTGVLVSLSSFPQLSFQTTSMAAALMRCLGGSDGDLTNNAGQGYSWDNGNQKTTGLTSPTTGSTLTQIYYTNPHLIKLIDATQDLPESVVGTKHATLEKADYPNSDIAGLNSQVPGFYVNTASRKNASTYVAGLTFSQGVYNTEGIFQSIRTATTVTNTDLNADPPGFYAVLVCTHVTTATQPVCDTFQLLTGGSGASLNALYYHVYTTTGYLQLVSPQSAVVTMPSNVAKYSPYFFSNTLYVTPNQNSDSNYYGNIDCESLGVLANYPYSKTYAGPHNALDCLNKGDMVMVLFAESASVSTIASRSPVYPDLYTVMKTSVQPYAKATNPHTIDDEVQRRQLVLNYGVNQVYGLNAAGSAYTAYDNTQATFAAKIASALGGGSVFKFYPPTGYNYVGECSNRGVCDPVQGVCTCFPGYTSDNCGVPNALAL